MEFLLCITTEARHANKSGGSNTTSVGVDLIPSLFLYSVGYGTRCGRTIHQDPSGIIGTAQVCELTEVNLDFAELPKKDISNELFNYMLEAYMDEYIALAIPRIQDQLHHVANAIMSRIHDVFLPEKDDTKNKISLKKILKKEAAWAIIKNVLGFEFDGNPGKHTIWLTEDRRTDILTKLKNVLGKKSIEKGYPF